MKEKFFELLQYRELLVVLTMRNLKVRYKQTIMGFLWAIFMPLVIVLSGVMVRKAMSIISGSPLELAQIVSVSVKALPWAFFIGAIRTSANSLVGHIGLIKKIYFPREVFPISYTLTQAFDSTIALVVLSILLIFAKIGVSIYLLWLPIMVLFLILFAIGLGMLLSCANVFFRDVRYVINIILTFGIFFTPVFYDANMFGKWQIILFLNPVGSILENINYVVVLHRAPDFFWLTYAGVVSVCVFLSGWFIFKKIEPLFAEYI